MNTQLPPTTGIDGSATALASASNAVTAPLPVGTDRKGIDLPILKKGAKDFLDFLDSSKEVFYAYLYHRTGSEKTALALLKEMYGDVLVRTMSLWWFGTLSIRLLLDRADAVTAQPSTNDADITQTYSASFPWLSAQERTSVSRLHDALWSLPIASQRLMILRILIGLSDERIADVLSMQIADVVSQVALAKDLLLQLSAGAVAVRARA
jgi:DNA-directed RNA polymerase specialized sigma24 family protein